MPANASSLHIYIWEDMPTNIIGRHMNIREDMSANTREDMPSNTKRWQRKAQVTKRYMGMLLFCCFDKVMVKDLIAYNTLSFPSS